MSSAPAVSEVSDFNIEKFSAFQVRLIDGNAVVSNTAVSLGSLLFNNPHGVIVQIIRRPGCWFCRGHARELSLLLRKLAGVGIHPTLIGIVKEIPNNDPKEISDFRTYFPDGTLYLDSSKNTYHFIGKKGFDKYSLWEIFSLRSIWHYSSLKGIDGNMFIGEGIIKGGTLVFSANKKCILKLNEEIGNLPVDKIENAIRAVHSEATAAGLITVQDNKEKAASEIAELPKDVKCQNNLCKL